LSLTVLLHGEKLCEGTEPCRGPLHLLQVLLERSRREGKGFAGLAVDDKWNGVLIVVRATGEGFDTSFYRVSTGLVEEEIRGMKTLLQLWPHKELKIFISPLED